MSGGEIRTELYTAPADCEGHLGIEGSRIVADVIMAELRQRELVK